MLGNRRGKKRGKMRKELYEVPDLAWLKKKFKDVKLGWLKASEMEVYLAYMLMHENDLEKTPYDLAEEYGYTESKIRKLQVEFAKRFLDYEKRECDKDFLKRIFNLMLSEDESHRIKLDLKPSEISFTIYDPADARTLRRIISKRGVMSYSDLSMQVFHLTPTVFAIMFRGCNESFDKRLNEELLSNGVSEKNLKAFFPTKCDKAVEKCKDGIKLIANQVMSSALSMVMQGSFK